MSHVPLPRIYAQPAVSPTVGQEVSDLRANVSRPATGFYSFYTFALVLVLSPLGQLGSEAAHRGSEFVMRIGRQDRSASQRVQESTRREGGDEEKQE